jgi:hypothetical protein
MSKEKWSIPTWMFFHGLAEKIDNDYYKTHNKEVFDIVNIICQNLPCPYCRVNATKYLKKIHINTLKTKEDLKMFFFDFHNHVNKKLGKKIFAKSILNKYKNINIFHAYKWFDQKFYGNYIIQHDFNKWRRNIVKEKVKHFFGSNWRKMFK